MTSQGPALSLLVFPNLWYNEPFSDVCVLLFSSVAIFNWFLSIHSQEIVHNIFSSQLAVKSPKDLSQIVFCSLCTCRFHDICWRYGAKSHIIPMIPYSTLTPLLLLPPTLLNKHPNSERCNFFQSNVRRLYTIILHSYYKPHDTNSNQFPLTLSRWI